MLTKESVLEIIKKNGVIKTQTIVTAFGSSRQYASRFLSTMVASGEILKIGSANTTRYTLPEYAEQHPEILLSAITRVFQNKLLEEHIVLNQIEATVPLLLKQPENIRSIFTFAFSEMLNNAIEHSHSEKIIVNISLKNDLLVFTVNDFGIGVFKNIMRKKHLQSELEAIQDLLKGKTTTLPVSHSGQGIFFTSRAGDEFILESGSYRLIVNNTIQDTFLQEITGRGKRKTGTRVTFKLSISSKKHLKAVFDEFSNIDEESNFGFDKTEVKIKLFIRGGVHISRSQARRVLVGLDQFRVIVFDFDKVPMIGQAFADEIFRVFQSKHPAIRLEATNMNETVQFMVNRVDKPHTA